MKTELLYVSIGSRDADYKFVVVVAQFRTAYSIGRHVGFIILNFATAIANL